MDVEFSDLSYVVRNVSMGGSRTILKSVSGRFRSGQLSAIMGPSGAGKSSLLNAVSGYKSVGVTGVLKTNGAPRDEFEFHKSSCYITQEDLLQPLLSALEAMQIAASLKLPTKTSQEQRNDVIVDILKDLGLWDHRHTRTEKLSGGQKKRLSIALELVNNPPVIFLDEPTSGLDDVSTRHCVAMLRRIAQQGRTVVCTIHQPSAALFETFDQVYIIGKGMCVYQGSTKALVSFLSSAGIECPKHYNPADFILEILETGPMVKTLSEMIGNGKLNKCNSSIIEPLSKHQGINIDKSVKRSSVNSLGVRRKLSFWSSNLYLDHPTTNWIQFYILLKRMFIQILRNTQGLRIQFFHHLLCGLAVGGMFYNNANDGTQMFNHLKFCVGVTLFVAYTQVMVPVLVYPQEVKLVKKEYFNRWYNITPYYAALTISKLPFQFIFNMIFLTLVYFMTGLPADVSRFALFCLVTNLVSLSAEGIGLAIGSIFNVTNGSAVGPMTIAPFLGLACYGFDFAKEITWYMSCLMKTSFLRSGVVGLILCVFGYGRRRLDCPDVYCHFDKPDVLLEYLDLTQVSVWHEVATLTALICIFRTISYLSLRMRFVL